MDRKILGSLWFTEMGSFGSIGIVLVDTGHGHKSYIGTSRGLNQKADEQKIANMGARFPTDVALKLFGLEH